MSQKINATDITEEEALKPMIFVARQKIKKLIRLSYVVK